MIAFCEAGYMEALLDGKVVYGVSKSEVTTTLEVLKRRLVLRGWHKVVRKVLLRGLNKLSSLTWEDDQPQTFLTFQTTWLMSGRSRIVQTIQETVSVIVAVSSFWKTVKKDTPKSKSENETETRQNKCKKERANQQKVAYFLISFCCFHFFFAFFDVMFLPFWSEQIFTCAFPSPFSFFIFLFFNLFQTSCFRIMLSGDHNLSDRVVIASLDVLDHCYLQWRHDTPALSESHSFGDMAKARLQPSTKFRLAGGRIDPGWLMFIDTCLYWCLFRSLISWVQ